MNPVFSDCQFRLDDLTGLETYGTPRMSDEALEFWADWYQRNSVALLGVRLLAFLQDPFLMACGLSDQIPGIAPPRTEGRRLNAAERFHVAEVIYRERNRKAAA